jgi:hypothetical protein
MLGELERCPRCQRRYPAPFGHRCPRASFTERRADEIEQGFRAWLDTNEGRFAAFLAQKQRPALG